MHETEARHGFRYDAITKIRSDFPIQPLWHVLEPGIILKAARAGGGASRIWLSPWKHGRGESSLCCDAIRFEPPSSLVYYTSTIDFWRAPLSSLLYHISSTISLVYHLVSPAHLLLCSASPSSLQGVMAATGRAIGPW